MTILVVDDDADLLGLIAFTLRQAGYVVLEAPEGRSALAAVQAEKPDLVILDVNMPGMSGFEVLRAMRAAGLETPVMILTVRSGEEDQVQGFDLGADDFVTKPFSPRTLLARVRALLRRSGAEKPALLTAGVFVLDTELQAISVRGEDPIRLTRLEFRLMHSLLAGAARPLSTDRLLHHVWGYRAGGDRQILKQLVHRLRQKIERDPANPEYLVTVSGVGYLLKT